MLIGFNETHLQIKKSVPAAPKGYTLIIKRRKAPHFGGVCQVLFFEKKWRKNKNGISEG